MDLLQGDLLSSVRKRLKDYEAADSIKADALERVNTLASSLGVNTKVSETDAKVIAQVYADLDEDLQHRVTDEGFTKDQIDSARRTVKYSRLSIGFRSIILLTFGQVPDML